MIKNENLFWRKIYTSPFFFFLGIIILIFCFVSFGKESYRYYKINKEVSSLKQEIKKLEEKKIQTKELIEYLETESFQEKQARLELGMKKPNEQVVILTGASKKIENKSIDINSENNKDTKENNSKIINPIKWWEYFSK
ncbi:MAG: septum formation initiator family protein [Patescibacteria group bacterium]